MWDACDTEMMEEGWMVISAEMVYSVEALCYDTAPPHFWCDEACVTRTSLRYNLARTVSSWPQGVVRYK